MSSLHAFILGAALMASMIMSFGPQNYFVIRTALRAEKIWIVPLVCFLCDALLTSCGVFLVGAVLGNSGSLRHTFSGLGAAFLCLYGMKVFFFSSDAFAGELHASSNNSGTLRNIAFALGFSLLNPWVYFDTLVVLGAGAVSLEPACRVFFTSGALFISAVWFFGISIAARAAAPILSDARTARLLDIFLGAVCFGSAAQIYFS